MCPARRILNHSNGKYLKLPEEVIPEEMRLQGRLDTGVQDKISAAFLAMIPWMYSITFIVLLSTRQDSDIV